MVVNDVLEQASQPNHVKQLLALENGKTGLPGPNVFRQDQENVSLMVNQHLGPNVVEIQLKNEHARNVKEMGETGASGVIVVNLISHVVREPRLDVEFVYLSLDSIALVKVRRKCLASINVKRRGHLGVDGLDVANLVEVAAGPGPGSV